MKSPIRPSIPSTCANPPTPRPVPIRPVTPKPYPWQR